MSGNHEKLGPKPYGQLVVFGVMTTILYGLLLTNQDLVSDYFTRGGWFALLPVGAAFVISFVHGNFTGSFWTVLGVEASRKTKEHK